MTSFVKRPPGLQTAATQTESKFYENGRCPCLDLNEPPHLGYALPYRTLLLQACFKFVHVVQGYLQGCAMLLVPLGVAEIGLLSVCKQAKKVDELDVVDPLLVDPRGVLHHSCM